MKKFRMLACTLVVAFLVSASVIAVAGNGNGPNSGSGGNSNNNGNGPKVWIQHSHGNGTWSLMQVPYGAVSGHAAHGDIWYYTGCPLSGPEFGCWPN